MRLIWNEPKEIQSAGKYVKNAYINDDDMEEFWELWNSKKDKIKEKGFSLGKYNEKWRLGYWTDDNDIEKINKTCYELCKELGFIENNNKKNEILDFINNKKDEFIKNKCLNLFNEIKEKIEDTL
jgi:hypothetical protein